MFGIEVNFDLACRRGYLVGVICNCNIFLLTLQVLPEGKYGQGNVLSKRQVWMSIFHIINFNQKKIHGHWGPGFF